MGKPLLVDSDTMRLTVTVFARGLALAFASGMRYQRKSPRTKSFNVIVALGKVDEPIPDPPAMDAWLDAATRILCANDK